MSNATATYTIISPTRALIEVNYSSGGFGMERVEVRYPCDLYEAAYRAANIKATIQGDRLDRFSKTA